MSRICLLFALAATLAVAADQPTIPQQLTLAQALDIALQNSTNIRTAMAQLDQASGRYEQSRSTLIPQLDVRAHQDYLTVNLAGLGFQVPGASSGKIGPFASMDARAFLKWQILNFSDIRGWQSSRSRQEASRLLVENARELVALRVVATYLEALKAKASRDTLEAERKLADELYRLTRDRVNQGVAAELDANRALQQVNSLLQQRQEAEQSYTEAKLSLANLLQAHVTAEYDVADEAAYGTGTPPDRDSTIKTALASRADYRSAEASVKAAQLQIRSQSKVGGKGQRGWPDEVPQQLVRHRCFNPLTGLFCCPLTFRSGTLLSAVVYLPVAPSAHCQALPHDDIPHTSGPITTSIARKLVC
jgi:outer membrane protein TolC